MYFLNTVFIFQLQHRPSSVYDNDSPHLHSSVWEYIEKNNIPVLGICYGMQEMAQHFGGVVSPSPEREFGRAELTVLADESIKTHLQSSNIGAMMMRYFLHFLQSNNFSCFRLIPRGRQCRRQ